MIAKSLNIECTVLEEVVIIKQNVHLAYYKKKIFKKRDKSHLKYFGNL